MRGISRTLCPSSQRQSGWRGEGTCRGDPTGRRNPRRTLPRPPARRRPPPPPRIHPSPRPQRHPPTERRRQFSATTCRCSCSAPRLPATQEQGRWDHLRLHLQNFRQLLLQSSVSIRAPMGGRLVLRVFRVPRRRTTVLARSFAHRPGKVCANFSDFWIS